MILKILNAEYGIREIATYNVTSILNNMIINNKLEIGTDININKLFCYDLGRPDPVPDRKKFLYISYQFTPVINRFSNSNVRGDVNGNVNGNVNVNGITNSFSNTNPLKKTINEVYSEFAEKLINPLYVVPKEVHIFIHCCLANSSGRDILLDQINNIIRSGLVPLIDGIHIGLLASQNDHNYSLLKTDLDRLNGIGLMNKLKMEFIIDRNDSWEFPTLDALHQLCLSKSQQGIQVSVLYLHTKGVNSFHNSGAFSKSQDWRRYMEHFLVFNYQGCLNRLNGVWDTVGVNLLPKPWKHYSGNFWWANGNYIKSLPRPSTFRKYKRYGAERWLLSNSKSKAKSVHQSGVNHYKKNYSSKNYI